MDLYNSPHEHHKQHELQSCTNDSIISTSNKEAAPFLKNLRTMLDVESDSILKWTADGTAFEIHDMDGMMTHILPKYFKHRKYTSFQRQLNYFNFRKWTKSKAKICTFSNDYFVRDQPELASKIRRKKSTSTSSPLRDTLVTVRDIEVSVNALPSGRNMWHKNVAIHVPQSHHYSHRVPYPSPTDVGFHGHSTPSYHTQTSNMNYSYSMEPMSPVTYNPRSQTVDVNPSDMDWIECLMPTNDDSSLSRPYALERHQFNIGGTRSAERIPLDRSNFQLRL